MFGCLSYACDLLFWLIMPLSSPIVTAASAEHLEQHDDDNDDRCSIHGNFPRAEVLLRAAVGRLQLCRSLYGLLDGHPVRYALHTVYVIGEFGGQVLFGCVLCLAI